MKKKCLLISGGYDSVSILELINRDEYDYFFFDYGQSYIYQEFESIKFVEEYYNIKINIINVYS